MRSFRVDYTKGISAVVDPNLLGDGFSVFLDGADLSAFAAASYRAPIFRMDVPAGTNHAFEYRGKWWFSDEHRHWAAEYVGKQERLYYTESGYTPGIGKVAIKIIDGVAATLGTPRPSCPVTVDTNMVAAPAYFSVEIGNDGSAFADVSNTYRLGYRTKDGLLPAGEAITTAIPKGKTCILKWAKPTLQGVEAVVIYGRTSGKEQIIEEVTPDVVQFTDNGSQSPHGEYASNLESSDVFYYFHTFLRNVNGHIDESGPSPRTRQIDTGKVRKIIRTPEYEGILDGSSEVTGAPAYKTVTQLEMCGSSYRNSYSRRVITTKTDHNLAIGDEVGIIPKNSALESNTPNQVYKAVPFDSDLSAPTITGFGAVTDDRWAAGVALSVKVTSWWKVQPIVGFGVWIEKESMPSGFSAFTTSYPIQALVKWSIDVGTLAAGVIFLGFKIYLDGKLIAVVDQNQAQYQFGPVTGDATKVPPASDPTHFPIPSITSFDDSNSDAPFTSGVVLNAKVTAFRGSGWGACFGGPPAESLPSTNVQFTTSATGRALLQWSFPAGEMDGFHVYIDGKWIATIPPTQYYLEFGPRTGDASRPVPTSNLSRSRAFHIQDDASMTWDAVLAAQAPLGYGVIAKAVETKIVKTNHGRAIGDLLTFKGYKEINGPRPVSRVGNANEFYIKMLTESDDATSTGRSYVLAISALQFVDKWALYVQRGTTDGIPLQQGVYPIDQLEVIDTKPVYGLSVTCDTSYYAQTPEGSILIEFDPPPLGLRCPTLHNQMLWGIVDNAVVWGPVNRPDAFPSAYRRTFPVPPVAIAPYGGAMIVILSTGVGRFDGTDPSNLSFTPTATRDGCIAPNTVQHTAAGLIYLSSRGLMAFQAELNTSIPITDGKVDPSLFNSASSNADSVWPAWWLPTRNSAGWAKCTRVLPTATPDRRENITEDVLPLQGMLEDIRSFYWRGRYYLYFTGPLFGNHGTIVVDTTRRSESGYPVFHMGLRPKHVHVTDRDQAFPLLGYN